jgi:hypothetical protein
MKAPMNMPGKKPAMKVPPENLVQTAGGRGEVESMPWIVVDGADENTGFKLSPTRYDPKIYKAQNPFSTSKPATVSQPQKLRTKPKLITTNAPSNVGNNDLKVPQAPSRPETSFTDILDEAGFPATERDAIGQVYQNPSVPNVPKVPHFYQATTGGEDEKKGYNANNRI